MSALETTRGLLDYSAARRAGIVSLDDSSTSMRRVDRALTPYILILRMYTVSRKKRPLSLTTPSKQTDFYISCDGAEAKCTVATAVCLSVCLPVPRCIPTLLHGPGCKLGE